jgi:hypothetical protein
MILLLVESEISDSLEYFFLNNLLNLFAFFKEPSIIVSGGTRLEIEFIEEGNLESGLLLINKVFELYLEC